MLQLFTAIALFTFCLVPAFAMANDDGGLAATLNKAQLAHKKLEDISWHLRRGPQATDPHTVKARALLEAAEAELAQVR